MKTYTITPDKWENTSEREREWLFHGASGPGQYIWDEEDSCYVSLPTDPSEHLPESAEGFDFDKGFGIGGISRRQPTTAEETALLDAQLRHAEYEEKRVRLGPLPHGQLWQPCFCGREPVCVDCECCCNHCDC